MFFQIDSQKNLKTTINRRTLARHLLLFEIYYKTVIGKFILRMNLIFLWKDICFKVTCYLSKFYHILLSTLSSY